jgi:hypothetical protein
MKLLVSAMHFAYFRNFESVLEALAAEGHDIHVAADEPETFGGRALVERLAAAYPRVTYGSVPSAADEPWMPFAQKIRYALDYARFRARRYADVPKLRVRSAERAPRIVRWLTEGFGAVGLVTRVLQWLERSMPRSPGMSAWLEALAPDAVILTSLTFSRSSAIEQLKAARGLGIPVGAAIMSWDHLSSKALLHVAPDKTLVWNPVQKREAVEMHGLSPESVVVTGAQCYDHWFTRRPSRARDEFCRDMGLDPSRPFVLYVCSAMSPVPTPVEPQFVRDWVLALRRSDDPRLREAGVLIRPHPERMKEWVNVTLDGIENVVVQGGTPIDSRSKADYFDALTHSNAVVGLCTSAFLEAAIVGRPVLTLLKPEYRMHQDGMAHFRYLLNVEGGLLHAAPDLAAHLRDLSDVLAQSNEREERNTRFLTAFVRPQGLDTPATPTFVDAVKELAQTPRRIDRRFARATAAQSFVGWLANLTHSRIGEWLMMDAIDMARARSEEHNEERKRELVERRAHYYAAKARAREEQARSRDHERRFNEWSKWRRGLNARKQLARLKGGLKQLVGSSHR